MEKSPVGIIGAPADVGAGAHGARMGPEALRIAELGDAIARFGNAVYDRGNLAGPDVHRRAAGPERIRNLPEVVAWSRLVFDAVRAELKCGHLPLLLGGDHSLSVGSIAAVAAHCRHVGKRLRILWLDAHADFNTAALTPSGNLHGMPVACLLGLGPFGPDEIAAGLPTIAPGELCQIGIRSVDEGEKRQVFDAGIEVLDMRYVDEVGMRETMTVALASVDAQTHLHVSLDVDFLDPEIAPGVATPVRGGPTYREAQLCMEMIADVRCLGSLDIMELSPAADTRNRTAELVVDLIESLFGKSTLMRGTPSPR